MLLDNGDGGTKRIRADRVGVQLDSSLTQPGMAAPADVVGNSIGDVKGITNGLSARTDNLFDKYNADIENIVANGTKVNNQPSARSVVIPVNITDQTHVTVTRTVMSSRFTVAKLTSYPVVGQATAGALSDNSAESLTVSVDSTIKYISIYFWLESSDTLTPKQILDGLMVEYGNVYTGYQEPYKPANQDSLDNLITITTEPSTEEVALSFEAATGYYSKNKSFSTYDGVTTAKIETVPGDRYFLNSRSYYNAAIACLLDSSNAVKQTIWIDNSTAQHRDISITIPEGVSYLLIQRLYNYSPTTLRKITAIRNKSIKSVLNGKNITLIGDSITEKNGTASTNWALYMGDWCGANIQNLGASGTGFIAGNANPYHNRITRISNPDIIGVALSFNDMSNTIADLTTAAETFFDDLITAYPTVPIVCYVQSPWSAYHPGVEKSDQWVAALRSICHVRGVPFYDDMYNGSALKPWLAANRAVYYMNDGEGSSGQEDWVHPNSEGHKIIARHLYQKFAENIIATGIDYLS